MTHRLKQLGVKAIVALGLGLSAWTSVVNAQQGRLTWLGTLGGRNSWAYDISADGSVVVGWAQNEMGHKRAFRWTRQDGMQDLGTLGGRESEALAVSPNGSIVVGWAHDSRNQKRAFLWQNGTMIDLGVLPDYRGLDYYANGVSADGSVVVGEASGLQTKRAFYWTRSGGMRDLNPQTPSTIAAEANDVSADGLLIVGISEYDSSARRATRWTANGERQDLGTLGGRTSGASAVSADGSVIVGWSQPTGSSSFRAFRWQNGSMQELSRPRGISETFARDVSADGSIVVGSGGLTLGLVDRAIVWINGEAMQLDDIANLSRGSFLKHAEAIDSEGRYIVGGGQNAEARRDEAYLLELCLDTDSDCICDGWERNGLDVNGDGVVDLNLPALGARVGVKDIFVEYDSMQGLAPSQQAIDSVVNTFRARGVALHVIDGGDQNIPLADWPNAWAGFDATKARYFGSPSERSSSNWQNIRHAKMQVFRYCVFARSHSGTSSSGYAEVPGNDFMVTLGHEAWQRTRAQLPQSFGGRIVTWDDIVAGTFMHELGHTLGLRHGGGDDINHKPNYGSVMNYLWQTPHPAYASSWRLDFSDRVFNTLNERELSEPLGIGGREGMRVPIGGNESLSVILVNESGPVDWNRDGDTEDSGVSRDVNGDRRLTVLQSYDDWSNLRCECGPNIADGVHVNWGTDEPELKELTFSEWLRLAPLPGDTNRDWCIDEVDLTTVLSQFGQAGTNLSGDVNNDGAVDDADLLGVLFNFGFGECP